MTQRQCNKYMQIAKSNWNSSSNLDINSEVLLLAFEPEEREVIREDLANAIAFYKISTGFRTEAAKARAQQLLRLCCLLSLPHSRTVSVHIVRKLFREAPLA